MATPLPPITDGSRLDTAAAVLAAAEAPVVLAGPGVVRADAVDGLRALASAGSLGVLNTWGAKGVFDWRSPHHLATAGLQAHDFALAGLADADLIVATGVDEHEARADWRLAPVLEVPPAALGALAARWSRPEREIAVPPLRAELARVTQEGWAVDQAPLPPSRVTLHYSEVLGPDGLVVADPGLAGYWVARTFPTARLGGAIVPGAVEPRGLAAACALTSRLTDRARPVLLATHEIDAATADVLRVADELGASLAVEVWCADGELLDARAHRARLAQLLERGGTVTLGTDPAQLAAMLAVAGPVVAWGGLPGQAGPMEDA